MEKIAKSSAAQPEDMPTHSPASKYIKQSAAFNSGALERNITLVKKPVEGQMDNSFAKLSEAMYVAEQKAIEAVTLKKKVDEILMLKEKERKEQELRALAHKA